MISLNQSRYWLFKAFVKGWAFLLHFLQVVENLCYWILPSLFKYCSKKIEKSSTLQQMLLFIDSIVNHPSQTDVIYLDISKAFDTGSHGILLSKLWHFGISGSLWAWFKFQSTTISHMPYLWSLESHRVVFWVLCCF